MCAWAVENIDPAQIIQENTLFLDYLAQKSEILDFYSHPPLDFCGAYRQRRNASYPRKQLAETLAAYSAALPASHKTLRNAKLLGERDTLCVVTGQQAGFLGGPLYTFYKIATTIRLAEQLQRQLEIPCVPVFWLATEDHDFAEINHAYLQKHDGTLGSVRFDWDRRGNSISDLRIDARVRKAYDDYFTHSRPGPHHAQLRELFAFEGEERYARWCARIWDRVFSEYGLLIVEPQTIRHLATGFFGRALRNREQIARLLNGAATRLRRGGYTPVLSEETSGTLYTYDRDGRRVRAPVVQAGPAELDPQRYSADVVLRPLLQDSILPVVASVLGPGEIAYQAMLKPLYELFAIRQPLLFPRKSYTVVRPQHSEAAARYRVTILDLLTKQIDIDRTFDGLTPADGLQAFEQTRDGLQRVLAPLQQQVQAVDPNLGRSWQSTVSAVIYRVDKLQKRFANATLSRTGISKRDFLNLLIGLKPRNRPQDRVFPLPHLLNDFGLASVPAFLALGQLEDFSHHIVTWERQRETD